MKRYCLAVNDYGVVYRIFHKKKKKMLKMARKMTKRSTEGNVFVAYRMKKV